MTSAGTLDAHQHFWDPGRADYPWLTEDLAAIRRPFGPADLAPLLAARGIERSILVQTRSSLDETREFLDLAGNAGFVAGVVGWVDLTEPGVDETIADLRAGPGGGRLVGIRHQVHDEVDPDWLGRADVRAGLRAVADAGLAYDLLVRERELPAALDVVRALPDLRFVLDHLAKPPIRDRRMEPWAGRFAALAGEPNVSCKVSGLVTEADVDGWTVEDLEPYVRHALDTFGPGRLMFGSDWPVCLLAASYERVHEAATTLLADLGAAERSGVFGGVGAAVYRLTPAA